MADRNQKKKNVPETGFKKPAEPISDKSPLILDLSNTNSLLPEAAAKGKHNFKIKKTPGMLARAKFIERGGLFPDTPRFTPVQLGKFERPPLNEKNLRESVIIIKGTPDLSSIEATEAAVKIDKEQDLYIKSRIIDVISAKISHMKSEERSEYINETTIVEALKSNAQLRERLINNEAFRSLVGLPTIENGERPADAFAQAAASKQSLALVPSERWAERTTGRKENPAAFIRRVYAKELADGSLTRPGLRALDFPLARAFDMWVSRHPEDKPLLPLAPYVAERNATSRTQPLSAAERSAAYHARRSLRT